MSWHAYWHLAGLAVAVVSLGGCEDRCGPDGYWTDVTTRHGDHDGYRVQADCAAEADMVSVQGHGQRWSRGVAPGTPGRSQAFADLADLVAVTLATEITAPSYRVFVAAAPQAGCKSAEAVLVTLRRWDHLDAAILVAGRLLKQQDLQEEVLIQLGPLCEAAGY